MLNLNNRTVQIVQNEEYYFEKEFNLFKSEFN